jgi:hypothetical protein
LKERAGEKDRERMKERENSGKVFDGKKDKGCNECMTGWNKREIEREREMQER